MYLIPGTNLDQIKDKLLFYPRRGYDYTSLFGPSSLEIAESRLGIFFLRGTSSEGGSNQLWNHSRPVQMLRDQERVSLPRKLVSSLPDGGLVVTDGSLSQPLSASDKSVNEFSSFSQYNHLHPNKKAMEIAKPFYDSLGNLFTCIGYVDSRNRPTLIWQISKK